MNDIELARSLKAQFDILATGNPGLANQLLEPFRFQVGHRYIGQMNFNEFAGVFHVTSRTPNTVTGFECTPHQWEVLGTSRCTFKFPEETYEVRIHQVTRGYETIQTPLAYYNLSCQWPRRGAAQ